MQKELFFASFFRIISKIAQIILIKILSKTMARQKAMQSEHRKNYILRIINYFVKMSVKRVAFYNVCRK